MILNTYFTKLKLSISSLDYYFQAINQPLKNSFIFFIVTISLLGLFRGIYDATIELPNTKSEIYIALDELNDNFDPDLEIIWADNQLELNKDYVDVNWPSMIDYQDYELTSSIAVISNSETPPEKSGVLAEKNPLVYVNRNNLYTPYENNDEREWSEYPLINMFGGVGSYSINKQNLPKIILSIKESVDGMFVVIQFVDTVLIYFLYLSSRFWFLIAESILVYFLFKIYKFGFDFKKILKLNLNILVPTEIVHFFSDMIYSDLSFPIDTIAFWIILIYITANLKKNIVSKEKI